MSTEIVWILPTMLPMLIPLLLLGMLHVSKASSLVRVRFQDGYRLGILLEFRGKAIWTRRDKRSRSMASRTWSMVGTRAILMDFLCRSGRVGHGNVSTDESDHCNGAGGGDATRFLSIQRLSW
ncbi:MAG: hypothetical protein J3Q66DRAFT_95884 [Benniella sp.]|nr:MAG: hypothetical protein J3Q66DRAFT_95884 [Benniella sp.]